MGSEQIHVECTEEEFSEVEGFCLLDELGDGLGTIEVVRYHEPTVIPFKDGMALARELVGIL